MENMCIKIEYLESLNNLQKNKIKLPAFIKLKAYLKFSIFHNVQPILF